MITTILTIVTVIISAISFQNISIRNKLIFNPYVIYHRKEWYRFVTSGFIHSDLIHLAFNMIVLYSLGNTVELEFNDVFEERGIAYYIILYLSALVMSIIPTYKNHRENPGYNGLGASGAVSAVLFTYILFNPMQKLYIYGIIAVPGVIIGVVYIIISYYMGKKGGDNVNHSAHLWGALYGFTYCIFLKPSLIVEFFDKLIYFRDAI